MRNFWKMNPPTLAALPHLPIIVVNYFLKQIFLKLAGNVNDGEDGIPLLYFIFKTSKSEDICNN
jgi:hypothetical protein